MGSVRSWDSAGRGGRVDSMSAYYTGGLPIESQQPTSVRNVACREHDRPPCRIHAYTVYTPIGGKGRCHTSCDLQDHSTQARKSAGDRTRRFYQLSESVRV